MLCPLYGNLRDTLECLIKADLIDKQNSFTIYADSEFQNASNKPLMENTKVTATSGLMQFYDLNIELIL